MIKTIWSINEWGKLHSVLLGRTALANIPSMEDLSQRNFDRLTDSELPNISPGPFPKHVLEETDEDLLIFENALRDAGVEIHHADKIDLSKPVENPYWRADQETAINIRDLTLIHGDLTITAPSATRGRYFECFAIRRPLHEYYAKQKYKGYLSPPRQMLKDEIYDLNRECGINNCEPLFDAANCMRFGKDIIIDINNTANDAGAQWLQTTCDTYFGQGVVTIHPVNFYTDHMDVVVIPLCEGTALINTQYVDKNKLPAFLDNWKLIDAPEMVPQPFFTGTQKASNEIGLNIFILNGDERTVFVEERQLPLINCLTSHGFRPIVLPWRHGRSWGGSFHCVTLDLHRDGEL